MGYPEKFRIDSGVSQTQLYRQFGNSVAVPVVEAVTANVIKAINENEHSRKDNTKRPKFANSI